MNPRSVITHLREATRQSRLAAESLLPPGTRHHLALARYEFRSALADLIDPGDPPTPPGKAGASTSRTRSRRIDIEED